MEWNWKAGDLAAGLACYRDGEFFEAHEHWEIVWLGMEEPEKSFLQALIQTSAAFHHLRRGNVRGAVSLLRRVSRRLEGRPARVAGIAVEPLRAEVAGWLEALALGGERPRGYPAIVPMCGTEV